MLFNTFYNLNCPITSVWLYKTCLRGLMVKNGWVKIGPKRVDYPPPKGTFYFTGYPLSLIGYISTHTHSQPPNLSLNLTMLQNCSLNVNGVCNYYCYRICSLNLHIHFIGCSVDVDVAHYSHKNLTGLPRVMLKKGDIKPNVKIFRKKGLWCVFFLNQYCPMGGRRRFLGIYLGFLIPYQYNYIYF